MGKKYAYSYCKEEQYRTGFDSIAEALEDAQERKPEAETVYIAETRKYIPDVWACGVIEELQQDVYDMGYDGEYLDDVICEDEKALCDMFTATFVKWAKERSIAYWVDVVQSGTERMYNLKTGRRMR